MERSKFNAILTEKCPRCREGEVFTHPAYRLGDFLKTHTTCPKCEVKYEVEPGFFWGAMFINYGFNVATLVATSLAIWLLWNPEPAWPYIVIPIILALVTAPRTSRWSRMLLLHLISPIKYDPKALVVE